jgi:hypothetical protein
MTPKTKTTQMRTMGTLGDEHQHTPYWVWYPRAQGGAMMLSEKTEGITSSIPKNCLN